MHKMKKKRRYITLVEMMIVMFLIAMITGVIAYNYTGSLEEGKAFKTRAGMQKIETILALEAANGDLENVSSHWRAILENSPLVQNAADLAKDGWGEPYQVDVEEGKIVIKSKKLEDYERRNKKSI
jgi:general secretion pathway protein G